MLYIGQLEKRHVSFFMEAINKAGTQGYSPIIGRYLNNPKIMVLFDDNLWAKILLIVEDSFYWKWSNEKARLEVLDNILDQVDLINNLIELEIEK